MTYSSIMNDDYQLWAWITIVSHAIFRTEEAEFRKYGLSVMEFSVLLSLRIIKYDATPAKIARTLYKTSTATSGLIKRMEKRGLITKSKDLDKKNMVRISATEKGQQAFDQACSSDSIHRIMSSLSEERRKQLLSDLGTLWEAVNRETAKNWNLRVLDLP